MVLTREPVRTPEPTAARPWVRAEHATVQVHAHRVGPTRVVTGGHHQDVAVQESIAIRVRQLERAERDVPFVVSAGREGLIDILEVRPRAHNLRGRLGEGRRVGCGPPRLEVGCGRLCPGSSGCQGQERERRRGSRHCWNDALPSHRAAFRSCTHRLNRNAFSGSARSIP